MSALPVTETTPTPAECDREALAAALHASSSEMSIISRGVFDDEEEDEEDEEAYKRGEGGGGAGERRRLSIVRETTGDAAESKVVRSERRQLATELLDALYLGTSNFFLAYNTRAGIAVVLRALKLIQRRQFAAAVDLRELLGEKNLAFRVDAVRLGLFLGWFTGGYRGLRALLPFVLRRLFALRRHYCRQIASGCSKSTTKLDDKAQSSALTKPVDEKQVSETDASRIDQLSSLLAGALAGGALIAFDGKRRRSFALYALTRALQCAYNTAKQKQYWHFWGSDWQYGDALLFALSSAQVMYAYVMRPNTLPPEYFRFIQNTGPVELETLELVQQANRGQLISQDTLRALIARKNIPIDGLTLPYGPGDVVPCRLVHCDARSCTHGAMQCFRGAFMRTFPLYLSLFIVPGVVIHFKKFVRAPFSSLARSVLNATRSNTFLASFVTVYLAAVCVHRRLVSTDHRIAYYIAGLVASTTILLEPKSRRSELALYVLPRAIDSLALILRDRKIFSGFRHGEVALFSASMAVMMYSYEHEKETVSPFLYSTMRRFLQTSTDKMEQHLAVLEQQRKVQAQKQEQSQ